MHRRTLLGAALAAPSLLPRIGRAAELDEAAARKEGEVTWYITHYSAELAQQAADAFTKTNGIKVNVIRTTAGVAFERLQQEYRVKAVNCDVFSSTDTGQYLRLKKAKRLAVVNPPNAAGILKEFQNYDPAHMYYPTSYGLIGICYNTARVKAETVPKTWPGLTDAKWTDKVALGHPSFSAYAGTWALQMRRMYGLEYLKALAKVNPLVGRSINDTVTMLNSGERVIAAGPTQTTIDSILRGNPLAVTYPEDGSVLIISPSSVLVDAPHPAAARLFLNFLLGPEHSRIQAAVGGLPLVAGIPTVKDVKLPGEIKAIRPTDEQIEEELPKLKEEWRDIFGA